MSNRLKNIAPKISQAARLKVLTLDIETRPNLAHVWGLWQQNVGLSQIVERGHVMCWVAKWYGEKDPIFMSDHHDGHDAMIEGIWKLLDEADAVVTWNGVSFDMKHLRREFVLAGLTPPSPWKDIDLMLTVKREMRFPSNKLDNVAQELGIGGKVHHTGFDLWNRCMADDPKAWETMRKYNIQDVKLTEKLYDKLRPWIKNHPHMGMWVDSGDADLFACANCGHTVRETGKTIHTNVQQYTGYVCPNCGAHARGTARLKNPTRTRSAR